MLVPRRRADAARRCEGRCAGVPRPRSRKLRVGLVTFSGDVSVAAAPTHDRDRLHRSVAAITRWQAGGGTAIGDALARAVELGRDAFASRARHGRRTARRKRGKGAVTILFLSDGRQNRGLLPPAEGASLAAAAGIPVFTVALGTDRPDAGRRADAGTAASASAACPTGRP